ncbi:AzlD domain-containing protein [Zoogloeaceae bacterium G21618-S1]|nr:AzlD domain-containing protein [Zoogloeaceae bacterium G21618-S1]
MTIAALLAGMFLATYLTRASFLVFGHRLRFPPALKAALHHVPVAVLTAIIVPEALAPGGQLDVSLGNPWLVGTVVAAVVARLSGHLLLSLAVSFAAFGLMRWW